MHYIWCRNREIDQDWQRCVGRRGISKAVIERCSTGDEGRRLLREDLKLAKELGITSSPTWLANNRFVFHGNTPEAIRQAFCGRNRGLRGCDRPLSKTEDAKRQEAPAGGQRR
jgi:hypothetical protein